MFSKLLCAAIAGVVVGQNNDTTTTSAAGNSTDTTTSAAPTATTTTTPVVLGTLAVTTTDVWNTTGGNVAPTTDTLNAHADADTSNNFNNAEDRKKYFDAKMSAMQAGITQTMSAIATKALAKEDMSFATPGRRLGSHDGSLSLNFVTSAEVKADPTLDAAGVAAAKSAVTAAVSNSSLISSFQDAFKSTMDSQAVALGITAGAPTLTITAAVDTSATSAAPPVVAGVSAVLAMLATLF
jgi:hypothetical protein